MAEYETLAEGAEPPGRWVEREGGLRKWKGQVAWRVTRGDAVVTVELGRWAAVEGATLPDGSPAGHLRAAVRNLFDGGDLWHATREGVTEVTHGRVVARDDGVTFVPDAVQPGPRRATGRTRAGRTSATRWPPTPTSSPRWRGTTSRPRPTSPSRTAAT